MEASRWFHRCRQKGFPIRLFDKRIVREFFGIFALVSTTLSTALIFLDIPEGIRLIAGIGTLVGLLIVYIGLWCRMRHLRAVDLQIRGSPVRIMAGDIFKQEGLKVIAFNEYFDTIVDDRIIAKNSVNGVFIENHLDVQPSELDRLIREYEFQDGANLGETERERIRGGKSIRYKIGTIYVHKEYLLTAFAKVGFSDEARLTMLEYLEFLINFWNNINRVYAQQSVSTTIFGSGITRIQDHLDIDDEDLLKIMLWTFRISEMRFKHPAKLTIVVHPEKMNRINLLEIKALQDGL